MNHIVKRSLTPLFVILLAGSLAGCYTHLKHPEVTDYPEETQVIYIIPEPWPIPPPPPPPPPPPVPPQPPRDEPPPPPPPPPTRPIDPKQPEKPGTELKEKEPLGKKVIERQSTKTS